MTDDSHHITGGYVHKVNTSLIRGPVMGYNLTITPADCNFVNNDPPFVDVFTKISCLLNYDYDMYGTLLDFISFDLGFDFFINLIATTKNLICVENRVVKRILPLPNPKSCAISQIDHLTFILTCNEGTTTKMTLIKEVISCANLKVKKLEKPA